MAITIGAVSAFMNGSPQTTANYLIGCGNITASTYAYYSLMIPFTTDSNGATSLTVDLTLLAWQADISAQLNAAVSAVENDTNYIQSYNGSGTECTVTKDSSNCALNVALSNLGLLPNTTYYLYIYQRTEAYSKDLTFYPGSSQVSITGSGSYGGIVYIDNGTAFEQYQCYIDNGTEWELYQPCVDNGTAWEDY